MAETPVKPVADTTSPAAKPAAGGMMDTLGDLGGRANNLVTQYVPGGWGTLAGAGVGALLGYLLRNKRSGGMGSALGGAALGGLAGWGAQKLPWQQWWNKLKGMGGATTPPAQQQAPVAPNANT